MELTDKPKAPSKKVDSKGIAIEELLKRIETLETELAKLKSPDEGSKAAQGNNKVSMVVFSGTLDKILAAMNIATGSAALGCEVCLFFTFWATPAMRKGPLTGKKSMMEKMFGTMLPAGFDKLKLSTMNWAGMGTAMIKRRMKQKNIVDLNKLMEMAEELKVKIYICEMSMDLMGMTMQDLREYPGLEACGVGTFMSHALNSRVTLFI